MSKINIDEILGNIGSKYDYTDHVDGMQRDPSTMSTTEFKQEYTVIIRKKKYYGISATEGENAYVRVYQINNFTSISTAISTEGSPGSCNVSISGNTKIVCAERSDQDDAGWANFSSLLSGWSYNIDDNSTKMGSNGNFIYDNGFFDNIDDMKKMKYGWKVAEKCDFEPMDEIYVYSKSRHEKEDNKYKVYLVFFGYISEVAKSYSAGKTNPLINIRANDHLKLLQISYIANTSALDYRYAFAGAHYDKDFAGNLIIDDQPLNQDGPEIPANPIFTNVFAGKYPYEIIIRCAKDAGIPDKYLQKRIEQIKRIPFMPQLKDKPIEVYQSDTKPRLEFCQKAAENLFLEFFADEEGNIVLKIPSYTLGVNRLPANNAYIDTLMTSEDKTAAANSGKHEKIVEKEVTTYETITETMSETITHTVVKGDTLWDISRKYIGDATNWPEIYDINRNKIKDPHWIYPGQVLYIKKGTSVQKQVEKKIKVQTKEIVDGGDLSSVTDKYIPIIQDNEIISFVLTDSDQQVANCFEIHQEVPLIQSAADGVPPSVKRVVQDWQSIIRFGMRPAKTISTPLLDSEIGPVLFGTLMVQRSLSQRYKGTLTMIEEASIKVGDPIRLFMYDEHPYKFDSNQIKNGYAQGVFYVDRVERSIKSDGVSTMTLSLSAGRVMGMESIYDKLSVLYSRYFDEYDKVDITPYLNTKSNSNSSSGVTTGTARQNEILSYAQQFLGCPYVWGGKGPNEFDCSGFVSYVFKHFNINIPAYTYTMKDYGNEVNLNSLQPADMIFFNSFGHVGIYLGNNQFIHAHGSQSKQRGPYKVEIAQLADWYKTNLCGARRLI